MEKTTYSKYQNFHGEIDQGKEAETVAALLQLDRTKIDDLYILAYRKLLEEGEEVTRESLENYFDYLYWVVIYSYSTNDLKALQKSSFDYVSTNLDVIYDENGAITDILEPLDINSNNCYILNNRIYEIR